MTPCAGSLDAPGASRGSRRTTSSGSGFTVSGSKITMSAAMPGRKSQVMSERPKVEALSKVSAGAPPAPTSSPPPSRTSIRRAAGSKSQSRSGTGRARAAIRQADDRVQVESGSWRRLRRRRCSRTVLTIRCRGSPRRQRSRNASMTPLPCVLAISPRVLPSYCLFFGRTALCRNHAVPPGRCRYPGGGVLTLNSTRLGVQLFADFRIGVGLQHFLERGQGRSGATPVTCRKGLGVAHREIARRCGSAMHIG